MAFQDYFGTPIAYDPTTGELVKDATFTVHAVDDVALATPLATTDPASGVTIELRSSSVGVLPDFRVAGDPAQVILKSGAFVTKLTSVFGAVLDAGLGPDTVAAAIEAATTSAADAAAAVEARTGAETARDATVEMQQSSFTTIVNDTTGAGRLALNGAFVGKSGAETIAGVKTFSTAPVVPDASFGFPKVNGLQAALDGKATLPDVGTKAVGKGELVLNTQDNGVVMSVSTPSGSALNTLIAANVGKVAQIPAGALAADGVVFNVPFTLRGGGAAMARFATAGVYAGVTIWSTTGTAPMFTLNGTAQTLENLVLDARGRAVIGLLMQFGMEARIRHVRVISAANSGIVFAVSQNNELYDIFVDNSGVTGTTNADTVAAVVVRSDTTNPAGQQRTNTFQAVKLTVERSKGPSIDWAWDPRDHNDAGISQASWDTEASTYRAEFLFDHLTHIEHPVDNGGVQNTFAAAERIGNVKAKTSLQKISYAGPYYNMEHDQTSDTTSSGIVAGGVLDGFGVYLGADTGIGAMTSSPYLVHLKKGNGYVAVAQQFRRYSTAAILIDATYGPDVFIDPSCLFDGVRVIDNRTVRNPYWFSGDLAVKGLIYSSGPAPTYLNGTHTTATAPISGYPQNTTAHGVLRFNTTQALAADEMLGQVTFAAGARWVDKVGTGIPVPMKGLVAKNGKTARLGLYAAADTAGTYIRIYNAYATTAADTGYEYEWATGGVFRAE